MEILWFRHSNENRNDWLNFGLIQLHYQGGIKLKELRLPDAIKYGFSPQILHHKDLKAKSFLLVNVDNRRIKCIIDNEDSFIHVSDLIEHVDLYFIAAYNEALFERKELPRFYNWQEGAQVNNYLQIMQSKINQLGFHFHKIRKFIPIAPTITVIEKRTPLMQKFANVENKVRNWLGSGINFNYRYKLYIKRYEQLLEMRKSDLTYDVVLKDSLWGWPIHRINLHKSLMSLENQGYDIHSYLGYTPSASIDGSDLLGLIKEDFPLITKEINENYELALSKSKLAVFACGFHWGWRNILMLALMQGIPVVTDRLLTESYFDLNEFKLWQVEDHEWSSLQSYLDPINQDLWQSIKLHNQSVFDKYMSPNVVAEYFVSQVKQFCAHG